MREVKEQIAEYLETCRNVRRLSVHTIDAYQNDLTQFAIALPVGTPMTGEIIRECLTKMATDSRRAPATVKRKIAAIRAFLRATDKELALNTFNSWSLKIRSPMRLPKAIPKSELSTLLKFARGGENAASIDSTTYLCLSLMTATGLRVSELCALRTNDIQLETGEIKVFGKGARERVVVIANRQVLKNIAKYVTDRKSLSDTDLPIFLNRRGRPLTAQCLRLRLHSLAKRSCVGRSVTPHMFRHTAATLLLEGGVDIRFVQRLLGHASIATTQIYTHVSDSALSTALKRADVMRAVI